MNKIEKLFLYLLTLVSFVSCNNGLTHDKQHILSRDSIDQYIEHIRSRHGIPGVALTIIKDGELIHKNNYGKANIEHNVSISDSSIFRVYSLTKLPVAIGVFQLIEQGKLSLNDSIGAHISGLPNNWNDIQIRHLLTHSSGLPDMVPFTEFRNLSEEEAKVKVFKQAIKFATGEKYNYNQTNFWLLQQIIEKISDQSFEHFILSNQFIMSEKDNFFSSDSRNIVQNRATPYFYFTTGKLQIDHPFGGEYFHAANGLNISMKKFIEWSTKFENDELISPVSKSKMWETFEYGRSDKIFTNGWDKRIVNKHESFGFSGSLVTAYRIFPKENLSIIFLANGLESYFNIENIVNHIASLVDSDITDTNNLIFELLLQGSLKKNNDDFKMYFKNLKNNNKYDQTNFEEQLNYVGYMLLNLKKNDKAIEIFELNSLEFPESWNVYDSLGETYEKNNNYILALKNYQKVLELNIENQYGHNIQLQEYIRRVKNFINN